MTMSDLELIQHINIDEEDLKNRVFEKVYANRIKETPLKSKDQQIKEARKNIDEHFEFSKNDFARGFELFLDVSDDKNKDRILNLITNGKILMKNFYEMQDLEKQGKAPKVEPGVQDNIEEIYQSALTEVQFYEDLARQKLAEGKNDDAACMFRFIVNLFFIHTPAWVGWAVCEIEMGHLDAAKFIYDSCVEMFPEDNLVACFAASFYLNNNEQDKGKKLLMEAKKRLEDGKFQETQIYKNVVELLK